MPANTPASRRDTPPRVLDLTASYRGARVEFDVGPAYEVIAVMQALSNPAGWSTYDQGAAWFDELRSRLSPTLRRQLELAPGQEHPEWAHLAGLMAAAPDRGDAGAVIDHLAALPVETIYRALIESEIHGEARRRNADLIEAAARGDLGARERLLEVAGSDCDFEDVRQLTALLDFDGPALRDRLIDGLRETAALLTDHLAAVMPALRRDVELRRDRVRGMSLEDAVESGTDGIHYTPEPGIRRVLLIPHAAMRPWVLIAEHGDTKIFMVAVSEALLAAGDDTPPARLVQVVKALAEEQRLRILRRLAGDGPLSLQQVADHLGVAKSTAHHHLVQLRAAGLVVVDLGADRAYRIRDGVADDVRHLLDSYVSGGAR